MRNMYACCMLYEWQVRKMHVRFMQCESLVGSENEPRSHRNRAMGTRGREDADRVASSMPFLRLRFSITNFSSGCATCTRIANRAFCYFGPIPGPSLTVLCLTFKEVHITAVFSRDFARPMENFRSSPEEMQQKIAYRRCHFIA